MTQVYAGKSGSLAGYQLTVNYSPSSTFTPGVYGATLWITDNMSQMDVITSYGFSNNYQSYINTLSTGISTSVPYNYTWPLIVPGGTTFTANAPFPSYAITNNYTAPYLYSSSTSLTVPLSPQGILNNPYYYKFYLGNPNILGNSETQYITVITGKSVPVEPIPFIVNLGSLNDSTFGAIGTIILNQISTLTLPTQIKGFPWSLYWELSLIQPNGVSIQPITSTDGEGNFTSYWQNTMLGSYNLTITNYFGNPTSSWTKSLTYQVIKPSLTIFPQVKENKYRKLIKKSSLKSNKY